MLYHARDNWHSKYPNQALKNHLHQLGYVNLFDVWVLHKLSEQKLLDHISAYDSLLKCNGNILVLKQIVRDNEKWILYNNVEWKRSWGKQNEPPPTTPKAGIHSKKVMLCIWWDWKGVFYYELFLENQMINSKKYFSHLDQLRATLNENCPELVNRKCIIFHQSKITCVFDDQEKTVTAWLGSSDSSTLVTSHCTFGYPFISVFTKILLTEKISIPWKTAKGMEQFFAQKDKQFWEDRIMKLSERWQKVVEQNGEYVVQ